MLFQRLPITPSSGSGIHAGQKTGAWMRLASRCQPTAACAGQRSFADAFTESFPPQPASTNAASARAPSRFTAPLKPLSISSWLYTSIVAWKRLAARLVTVRLRAERSALDDVVDLQHFRLAREFDANVGQYRHQTLDGRIELLPRIPDLADSEAPARTESDVIDKPVRWPLAGGILHSLDGFVVLLARHVRCCSEASEDARVRRGGGH